MTEAPRLGPYTEHKRQTARSMVRMAGLVVLSYALYLGAHLVAGRVVPDGAVFGSVLLIIGGLWGVEVGKRYF